MNIKFLIVFAAFFVFASSSFVAAQTKTCPLDLYVIKYRPIDSEAPDFPVSGATASVTSTATKRLTKASLLEGMPRFANLREGKYKLSVTKKGYKQTVKQITINCGGLDDDGSVQETVFLQKGSVKQTYQMPNEVISSEGKTVNAPARVGISNSIPQTFKGTISGGVINKNAANLVAPAYPAAARAVKASGAVNVQVLINEQGNVVSAAAVSGHPLLRQAAEKAARDSEFKPTLLSGQPVKVTGIIVYNFVP